MRAMNCQTELSWSQRRYTRRSRRGHKNWNCQFDFSTPSDQATNEPWLLPEVGTV